MSHECHGSCSTQGHGNAQSGCNCSCHSCTCCCQHHQGKYADELLKLADQAWMEVLKEKIKEEIKQHSGDHLSQTAKLVAGANHVRWKEKLQSKKDLQDYEDQLRNLICSPQGNKNR